MTDSKIGSIRRKIEKLRRLGEHPASDPNEAAAALALAQRLMDQHGIAEAVLGIEDTEADAQGSETFAGSDPWRSVILGALARANGCATVRQPQRKQMRLFGRRSDVETVAYLFRYCVAEVERLVRKNGHGRGRSFASDYRKGAASAIGAAVEAESARSLREAREMHASDSKALVAIDQWKARGRDAEVARAREFPRLRRAPGFTYGSSGGFGAGQRDGAGIYSGRGDRARVGGGPLRLGDGR